MYSPRHLASILRDTIRRVELSTDINPDDPSLVELKRILLLKIAALEAESTQSAGTPERPAQPLLDSASESAIEEIPDAAPLPSLAG